MVQGRWIGTALVAVFSASMLAAAPDQDRPADRRAIIEGEGAWGGAFATGDGATATRLLADDFSGTGSDGQRYDKTTVLRWLSKGPNVASNATTVTSIRFFGEIAVVQGHDAVVDLPPKSARHEQVWTDIWMHRDGAWRVVSAHDTRVNEKP